VIPNPYTPSGRPRVFVGRETERRRLRDRLARVVAYGEMMGPLAVTTGPRGLGKTSLMRDMQAQAEASGFVVAWASGLKHQPFLADVVDRVTRSLSAAEQLPKAGRHQLQEIGLEVGIGLAKVSAKITRSAEAADGSPALVGPLEDFLHRASNLVRQANGAGLLIIIDELHAPLMSRREREYEPDPRAVLDAAVLLNAVQNMDGEREKFPLGVVGAGLPETKAYLTRAATFGERTHEFILQEFGQASARAVLVEPAEQLNVRWDDAALTEALAAAGGYPQSLHIIGSATWDAAQPEAGDILTLTHLTEGRATSDADLASLFRARWEVATKAEQDMLKAMASLTDTETERGAVAAELGVDTEALGMTRRSLISKGIIEAPRRGILRFTIPGFADWVRAKEPGGGHPAAILRPGPSPGGPPYDPPAGAPTHRPSR
jgi:hypothetical protein